MFSLRCTVRKCLAVLEPHEQGLRCPSGHHFDVAKEGYVNLLQPQDRKSKHPGDAQSAVMARHRWLNRGLAGNLIETLATVMSPSQAWPADVASVRTLDLGCGEGTFGPALFGDQADDYCGIDLSKQAIKLAARRWPKGTWVLANADRVLPVADRSVHRVVSLFGRRPASEIARVLAPNGICVVAIPADDDLVELRRQTQQSGHLRSRSEQVIEQMATAGLVKSAHKQWREHVELDPEAIADALAMTYRAVRHSQQSRLEGIGPMQVTLSADLLCFEEKPTAPTTGS